MSGIPHGKQVLVEYFTFSDRHRRKQAVITMDRAWYADPVLWTRDDGKGIWRPEILPLCLAAEPAAAPQLEGAAGGEAVRHQDPSLEDLLSRCVPQPSAPRRVAALMDAEPRRSLCHIETEVPLVALTDGVYARAFSGCVAGPAGCAPGNRAATPTFACTRGEPACRCGVVVEHDVEHDFGLVLCDRNTVVVAASDIMLSMVAYPAEIRARVVLLHPQRNFSLALYRPSELPAKAREAIRPVTIRVRPLDGKAHGIRCTRQPPLRRRARRSTAATRSGWWG